MILILIGAKTAYGLEFFFFVQARYYRMHNRDAGIFLFLPSKKKKIHDLDFFYITLSKFFLL